MAASKVDLSLDEIVTLGKKRGRGAGPAQKPVAVKTWGPGKKPGFPVGKNALQRQVPQRPQPVKARLGVSVVAAMTVKPRGDLRDILASKQKQQVVDLRAKIKPKGFRGRGRPLPGLQGRMVPGSPPKRPRSRSPIRKPYANNSPFSSPPAPPPPPPVMRRRKESPVRLPSSAETKKITVTVPGLNRPVSEQSSSLYRREEHLAAAIQRSKDARQDSFLRGREEVLAQAITSALGGGGGMERGGMEREAPVGASYAPRMRYNRSPSAGMEPPLSSYAPQHHAPAPPPPPPPAPPISRSKGITTMTTMTISNLSDTVSKNDIAELCGAVGSLETVTMPAPGVAEVIFKYKDDALEAFKKYNQRNLDGQPMICKLQATSRSRVMHTGGYASGMRGGYMENYGGDFNSYSSSFY